MSDWVAPKPKENLDQAWVSRLWRADLVVVVVVLVFEKRVGMCSENLVMGPRVRRRCCDFGPSRCASMSVGPEFLPLVSEPLLRLRVLLRTYLDSRTRGESSEES